MTLRCFEALLSQVPDSTDLAVFLTDDGSTDGTAEAVTEHYPEVRIIDADGSLFWCRGMERAWTAALAGDYDGYLWLNDDVALSDGALGRFLDFVEKVGELALLVGSMHDPETNEMTYGGFRRTSRWLPTRLEQVVPHDSSPLAIDTFNGNLVHVPARAVDRIGILDPTFSHALGDLDFGFRAAKSGVSVLLAPRTYGACRRNEGSSHGLRTIFARKGLPIHDWFVFSRRHSMIGLWPFVFLGPYVRAALRELGGSVGILRGERPRGV
ncbi:MAG: glycosyltransferase family 2 protein [bacterium]|nr:glycosyltransferase family 2 protein [bacterium]